jgi:hypothetical protein
LPRHAGLAAALALAAALLGVQLACCLPELRRYDRHVLPAFDAYVYTAMAEQPSVFTVPPWGYRILTPALVHWLSPGDPPRGFLVLSLACLTLSGGLLFLFLRRLGHAAGAALLAVAASALSLPVEQTLRYLFLVEPLSLVLLLLILLALESGGDAAVLALLFALGALNKEAFLLFLPAVYCARSGRDGARAALAKLAACAVAALGATEAVRAWQPQVRGAGMSLPAWETAWLAVYRILAGFGQWWDAALLHGVGALALLGALRPAARPLLRRHGYLLAVCLALPFAASVYTDDDRNVPFFPADIPRLMLFALPLLLPLALVALDRVWPNLEPRPAVPRPAVPWRVAAAVAAVATVVAPLANLDRYRRLDLRGPRDGRLLLALSRETRALARRLERGRPVAYQPEQRRFTPDGSDPHFLERMRWFLREGWGPAAPYGLGPVVMAGDAASIVLPCPRPDDLELTLTLSAPAASRVRLAVNDRELGELEVAPEPVALRRLAPAMALFRGDNLLRLSAPPGARVRLHELTVRRSTAAADASG